MRFSYTLKSRMYRLYVYFVGTVVPTIFKNEASIAIYCYHTNHMQFETRAYLCIFVYNLQSAQHLYLETRAYAILFLFDRHMQWVISCLFLVQHAITCIITSSLTFDKVNINIINTGHHES